LLNLRKIIVYILKQQTIVIISILLFVKEIF